MQNIEQSEVMLKNSSPLPKSKMPVCWDDDTRMDYLFSQIRPESVNPLDKETKMKFWTPLLETWCVHHSQPSFTLSSFKKAFQRNGRSPTCLSTIIETLYRNGELVEQSEFIHIPPQQTWTAWTIDILLKKPAVWTFNKVKNSVVKNNIEHDTIYVHIAACKELGNKLMDSIKSTHTHRILELSELAVLCGQQNLDQLCVVIHGLRRQNKATLKEDETILVKLGDTKITDLDVGVYMLQRNEKTLTRHVEQLEAEKENAVQEARTYVTRSMRQAAKSCLRKKQVLDKCIDKRLSALENIRLLLSHIREAQSDAEVLEAYRLGASALKTTLKTSGLTEDSAADTMVQVEEALDMHREIQAALAQPLEAEDDLEGELALLLTTEKDTLEDRLKDLSISDLPEPPQTLPASRLLKPTSTLLTDLPEPPQTLPTSHLPKPTPAGRTKQPTMEPA